MYHQGSGGMVYFGKAGRLQALERMYGRIEKIFSVQENSAPQRIFILGSELKLTKPTLLIKGMEG